MPSSEQIKQIIEALLFISDKPLTVAQIKEVLEEIEAKVIKSQIAQLQQEYIEGGRSFNIIEVAGGYQICTNSQFAPWLQKLHHKSRKEKLSSSSLETLAIVAYRQPVTRLEIEDIRGVSVEGVLRTLLEKSLVRISGRKEIAGRPFLYTTSKLFLEFFGLQSLEELPKLEEFETESIIMPSSPGIQNDAGDIREEEIGGKEDEETEQVSQENRSDR